MNTNQTAANLVRRFAAILLVVLAIVCLFWPSIISTVEDERDDKEDMYESYLDAQDGADRAKEKKERIRELKKSMDFSTADAKAFMNAYYAHTDLQYKPDLSLSELRTMSTASWTITRLGDKYIPNASIDDFSEQEEESFTLIKITTILTNVAFFGMLAAGVGAIVLMVLNKNGAVNFIFLAFAVLGTAAAVFFLIRSNAIAEEYMDKDGSWGLGVSLFLMPIFALAACILYKRDKSYPGAFPKRTAPAYGGCSDAPRAERPANNGWADAAPSERPARPANNGWADAAPSERPARPANNGWADATPSERPARPANNGWADAAPSERPARPARPATNGGWADAMPSERPARPARPATNGGWADATPSERPARPARPMTNGGWADAAPSERPARPARPRTNGGWTDAAPSERPAANDWAEPESAAETQILDERPAEEPQPVAQETVWYCKVCGTQNLPGAKFCPNCGTRK